MTHEGDPAVFVIHEVSGVREAIQGAARRSDGLICRTDSVAAC
jgi:dienelactone hydrolase